MKCSIIYLIILQRINSVSRGWYHGIISFTFFTIAIFLASCQCPRTSPVFQDALKINITDVKSHSAALLKLLITRFLELQKPRESGCCLVLSLVKFEVEGILLQSFKNQCGVCLFQEYRADTFIECLFCIPSSSGQVQWLRILKISAFLSSVLSF